MPKPKTKCKRPTTPGPKPSITREVVERVSERYAMGIPLVHALAAEQNPKINEETWKKALQVDRLKPQPELSPLWDGAKGKFLETALLRLAASEELSHLKWLLERRHPDLFSRPEAGTTVNVSQVVGIPDDVVDRARELAKQNEPSKA